MIKDIFKNVYTIGLWSNDKCNEDFNSGRPEFESEHKGFTWYGMVG